MKKKQDSAALLARRDSQNHSSQYIARETVNHPLNLSEGSTATTTTGNLECKNQWWGPREI